MDLVVKQPCSRCPRVEERAVSVAEVVAMAKSKDQNLESKHTGLLIHLDGDVVVDFSDLCTVCKEIVARYIRHIGKKLKHQSSLRDNEDEEAKE